MLPRLIPGSLAVRLLVATAAAVAVAAVLVPGGPAVANPDGPTPSPNGTPSASPAAVPSGAPSGAPAVDAPTAEEVAAAEADAARTAASVGEVRARLAAAQARLDAATITAARAAEEFNGARWRLRQAREEAWQAARQADRAGAEADRQRTIFGESLVSSYRSAPELRALTAIARSDGIETLIERSSAMRIGQDAMGARQEDLAAAEALAERAAARAAATKVAAGQASERARSALGRAREAQRAATALAAGVAAERSALIARWAQLRGISVELAARRQEALEADAPDGAPDGPGQGGADQQGGGAPDPDSAGDPSGPNPQSGPSPQPGPAPSPAPAPDPAPAPAPAAPPVTPPVTGPPPQAAGAAQRAIAFARRQLGERYVLGAAGPDRWDCSGLTMMAWARGGRALPHYSVAQYQQSTPIGRSQLRPGDLLFWGSSRSSSSIYHVALYVGDGMMIHAPRPGRTVEEVPIDYWIWPNFFARP
ncbi:MAG: C40 family peptidase [Nocardioides sp.]